MSETRTHAEGDDLITVAVPVKDNATTLEELVRRLDAVLDGQRREFVLVDDGSVDASWATLCELAATRPHVRPYRLTRNYGQQAALCAAFEKAAGAVIVTLDADLQYPPEAIPAFLAAWRDGHDLVCGHRVRRSDPYLRRVLPSRVFNVLVRWVSGSRVRDVGCALNAIDRSILEELPRCGERRRFLKPLLAEQARRMTQRPVEATRRVGKSSYGFLALCSLAIDFFVVYSARPFRWAFVAGVVLAGVAGSGLVAWAFEGALRGTWPWFPWGLGLVIALFLGFQLATLGLLGETLQRLGAEREGRPFYRFRGGGDDG